MLEYYVGQRWVSEMEPELGLGIIKAIENRTIRIHFPASNRERIYAIQSAPIKRVRFQIGDVVTTRNEQSFTVEQIDDSEGVLIYSGDNTSVPESELSDIMSFTSPRDRLLGGFFDYNRDFNLRAYAHRFRHHRLKSAVRGFIGGRIELIPHQLYVAHEVSSRQIPRVLLSDEVGLGKTIEACLILHRLIQAGRIQRVLVLAPESLVHQWFVELFRRFNLLFRIFDGAYCESLKTEDSDQNVFRSEQWALCSLDFIADQAEWNQQAIDAGWDMVVVDEAHHLTENSSEYRLVKKLGDNSPGLLLLTATPEQLGHRSHFTRLQLLDPARYYDFDVFEQEEQKYQRVAELANKILTQIPLSDSENAFLKDMFSDMIPVGKLDIKDDNDRRRIINHLMDRHGMGRVMFRNTRAAVSGFPERKVHLKKLAGNPALIDKINHEIQYDFTGKEIPDDINFKDDPRIQWLAEFLKKNRNTKVLLICCSIKKLQAIHKALEQKIKIKTALFHENLSLLQRDQNAAWFSDPDGPRLMICSEIGSEGRNFQFLSTLVMFDLPRNPELLEQRIGRLDRIGQKHTVNIYVPFVAATAHEVFVRWYHEGLSAFQRNIPGLYYIYQEFGEKLIEVGLHGTNDEIKKLMGDTSVFSKEISNKLEQGRDRLLELHSFRPSVSQELIEDIRTADNSRSLEQFMLRVFDRFGVAYQELQNRSYHISFDLLDDPNFPIPPMRNKVMTATFDRATALNREDIEFLSRDHPMVIGAIDVLLGTEKGNCTLAKWPVDESPELLLEAIFVAECVAPAHLNVERFLSPTPIRMLVDHSLQDLSDTYKERALNKRLRDVKNLPLLNNSQVRSELIPSMISRCGELAEQEKQQIVQLGLVSMKEVISDEIQRLLALKQVNPNIRNQEISAWEKERNDLFDVISNTRLRLDALRLIYKGNESN